MATTAARVLLLLAVFGTALATTEVMVGDDASAVAQAALGAYSCQWTDPGSGAQFDLSPLALPNGDYLGADPEPAVWNYKLNFCGRSNAGSGCTELDGAICRLDKQTGFPNMIFGSYVTSPPPTYALLASGNPADGFQLTFTNGQRCDGLSAADRTVILHMLCGSATTERFVVTTKTGKCTYGIDFTSPHACPLGSGNKGLSGGSVFLIILLVCTVVYVAGGCFYKRKQLGTTGMESCPNYAQWQQLPGLVADGWRFTKSKTCNKSSGDSANLL